MSSLLYKSHALIEVVEALEHGALSENPDFLAGIQATLQRS